MISVVIPAYNEQDRIGPTLLELHAALKKQPHEILIVTDGQDQTPQLVKKMKIPHTRVLAFKKRMGKGGAIVAGIKAARGSFIIMYDADGAMAASELKKLLPPLKNQDIAIGTRYASNSHARLSLLRKMTAWMFTRFTRILFGTKHTDTQCGYKAFRAKAAKTLAQQTKQTGFVWDVEMLYLAKKNGWKVAEVPIEWEEKGGGDLAGNTLKSVWHIFRDTIKLRIDYFRPKINS